MKIRGDEIYLSDISHWSKVFDIEAFIKDPNPKLAVGHEESAEVALDRAKQIAIKTGKHTTAHIMTYRDGSYYWILIGGFKPN